MQEFYPNKEKVVSYDAAGEVAKQAHLAGRKIVMVSGCYDIVHLGHVRFLTDAKALADLLIVSVGSDKSLTELKGAGRPVMNQEYRASMLASLLPVDYVVIENEPLQMPNRINFEQLVSKVKPDFFAVNNTDKSIDVKKELLNKYGCELKIVNVADSAITSTTELIKKIQSL
ncbi:MAG: adenylyltransferase/cytidyltransferase family protein [Candidatus Doudnabacteria bacterium]|nr:adenylyltransferase/cytidyltransferase family protein [Candidatus Doudnabacteria bacterium]